MNPLPRRCSAFACLCLLTTFAFAQPAFTSPEVLPDGRVTFRLKAPKAQAVAVKGLRHLPPQPMAKDDAGIWSATVGPLPPDLYSYIFDVDGATFTDPANRRTKEWLNEESLVEVPGNPPLSLALQPIPHGAVHRHVFTSRTRNGEVAVEVYTPPGFDAKAAITYPVVFLLHGFGDEETAWLAVGRANNIADSLVAQKRMTPAIIVMTNGHPVPIPTGDAPDYGLANLAAMEREILHDVLPFIEANYPVRRTSTDRAIVGLSMGGGQSLSIGLGHPDVFGWVGAFSSGLPEDDPDKRYGALLAAEQKKAGAPRLIWVGVGREDFLLEMNTKFHGWLESRQVPHEWHLTAGGHEWPVWRGYLEEFLQKIFR
jgi:enterochelin esterase family protein